MAIKETKVFYENVTSIPDEAPVLGLVNSDMLQLEVTGTATFKLGVYAQLVDKGEFFSVAAVSDKDFMINNPISSTGIYKVDVSGFLRVKIIIEELSGGELTCRGLVVSVQ